MKNSLWRMHHKAQNERHRKPLLPRVPRKMYQYAFLPPARSISSGSCSKTHPCIATKFFVSSSHLHCFESESPSVNFRADYCSRSRRYGQHQIHAVVGQVSRDAYEQIRASSCHPGSFRVRGSGRLGLHSSEHRRRSPLRSICIGSVVHNQSHRPERSSHGLAVSFSYDRHTQTPAQ